MKRSYALDMIKALSILFIICYHLWPSIFSGGFLFVNTFLVLAGFFATRRLEQVSSNKSIKPFIHHIGRVILRLWIPLFVMIALVLSSLLLINSPQLKSLRLDTLSSLLFLNNWYQLKSERSYFMDMAVQSPFAHLWYVAIYIQSFVLSAIIIKVTNYLKSKPVVKLFLWLSLVAGSQLLYFVFYAPGEDPSNIYYSILTRFSSFAYGVLLYYASSDIDDFIKQTLSDDIELFKTLGFYLSLVGMIGLGFITSDQSPITYLLWLNYFNLLTFIFIWSSKDTSFKLVTSLERLSIHRLGQMTYSMYLWYYPLIVFAQKNIRIIQSYIIHYEFLVLIVILIVGAIFYYFVEQNLDQLFVWKTRSFKQRSLQSSLLLLATLFLVALGISGDQKPVALFRLEYQQFQGKQNIAQVPFPGTKKINETTQWAKDLDERWQTAFSPIKLPPFSSKTFLTDVQLTQPMDLTADQTIFIENLQAADPELFDLLTLPEILYASSLPVTYFGDSLALGNSYTFRTLFDESNTYGYVSLQIWMSYPYIQELLDEGLLQENVVINLGTNAGLDEEGMTHLIEMMGDRTIYFVNTNSAVAHLKEVNDMIHWAAETYPNVFEIDWYSESIGHPEYYIEDDIHLTPTGADYYVALVAKTIYNQNYSY